MREILKRIITLAQKEFMTILRDPKSRMVLIAPPILQLMLFSFAATLEVKNVALAVYNQDQGRHGQEIARRLAATETFGQIVFLDNKDQGAALLDQQRVMAVVHIPQNFSRQVEGGGQGQVQIILDGRRSNSAQIAGGYLNGLIGQYSQELAATRQKSSPPPQLLIAQRHWFNENLDYKWFTVPSLVIILAVVVTLIVTAMSVARERELGTFDQLLVSPLKPLEILAGKTLPAMVIGFIECLLICGLGILVFDIPFRGSFVLFMLAIGLFLFSIVGFGLFISSLAQTQQQAILGTFIFMVPAVTLSGFAAPVENMPIWLQELTWLNPLKHGFILVRGLYLKAMPLDQVWANAWPLLVIGGVTLTAAARLFKSRLD